MITNNIGNFQRILNIRRSIMIHMMKEMTEFKEHSITRTAYMGFLERVIMVIIARSIFVKKITVVEDPNHRPTKSHLKECIKIVLGAKRIVKYKQSEKLFGTWIVWYV